MAAKKKVTKKVTARKSINKNAARQLEALEEKPKKPKGK